MPINTFRQDEDTKEVVKMHLLVRLMKYLKKHMKTVAAVFGLIAFILVIELINPYFLQIAIDYFIDETGDVKGLLLAGGIVAVLYLLATVALKYRLRLMAKVSNRVLYEIRQDLYKHLQKLSFHFYDNRATGKILARVIGDVNSLKQLFDQSILDLIPNVVKLICVMVIMMILNVELALYAYVMLPLLAAALWIIQRKSHKEWRIHRQKSSNLNAFSHESFTGVRVTQSFGEEKQMNRTFDHLVDEHKKSFMSAVLFADMFWACVELSWGIGSIIVYWVGVSRLGTSTEITVGLLVAFSSYIAMFWQPVMNLSNYYNNLVSNLAAAERIFEILDTEPDIRDEKDAVQIPVIKGKVEFKHVTFGYNPHIPVLKEFSFLAEPGQTVALVGPTGAGKTSIINLISHFYDIQKGEILVDDYNIRHVTMNSLRSQMGIMPQDTFLFSGSIRDNIRYGRLGATDEQIEAAAKAVHAHEFISKLEKGYDTDIRERGSLLSVGERQLIAFARAMLSDPRILVLDEATASIDTHTEQLVQAGIKQLLSGRTSFIIAHRLSTIQQADRILVVDDGRLAESGTHTELMKAKGMYYHLFMAQFKSVI